jgi:glycosyltransferase involved in cell wall biosynthesis
MCPQLILHWHAVGLGSWLGRHATGPERRLAQVQLGHADLAIVLAPELAGDAAVLQPQHIAVVANGISDPCSFAVAVPPRTSHCEILFLGLGSAEKGLRRTVEAVALLNDRAPDQWRLTFAGDFATPADATHFNRHATAAPAVFRRVGFADATQKRTLFAATDIFCFPSAYPHEGQPLTLVEAMAHDVRIVTTRWRAIPGMLPATSVWFTDSAEPAAVAASLDAARAAPLPGGALRRHYLAHFTRERHLTTLRSALLSIGS